MSDDTTSWPIYQSDKIVRAAAIVGLGSGGLVFVVTKAFGPREAFQPTPVENAHSPAIGDYAVVFANGLRAVIPKKQFEEDFKLLPPGTPT
jgi:hypothetical protein